MKFKKISDQTMLGYDLIELLESRVSKIERVKDYEIYYYEWIADCDGMITIIDETDFFDELGNGFYVLTN